MKTNLTMSLLLGGMLAAAAVAQEGTGELAPEAWVHDGDRDGDGLSDGFEVARGLDPDKAASFEDGTPDESRLASDGRTMWEAQKAEQEAAAGAGAGGSACGALGLEALLLVGLGWLRRR